MVFEEKKEELSKKSIILMHDVGYEHAVEDVQKQLTDRIQADVQKVKMDKDINFHRFTKSEEKPSHGVVEYHKNFLPVGLPPETCLVLYIGPESLALTNLMLRLGPSTDVFRYDAEKRCSKPESGSTNKLLQRRYVAVQKARDAQTIALLVGTLGLQSYLPLLKDLRHFLTKVQDKRVYTISVGKLNPAKLANFQEIDVFVLIACPENSLVEATSSVGSQNSRDFYKPIVTPFELLTAFKGRAWTGEYVLDLTQVYGQLEEANGQDNGRSQNSEESDEEPHFSLVTGGLVSNRHRARQAEKLDATDGVNDGIVTLRGKDGQLTKVMESAGAAHVASRSWRGLEQRIGMDEAAPLETGRTGTAAGYVMGTGHTQEGQS